MLRGWLVDTTAETRLGSTWKERLAIQTPDMEKPILSLSGGNQQKALFARALGSRADIILMDDPMRGVDVGTKREVYGLIREEAARGRTFLWYTTEADELEHWRLKDPIERVRAHLSRHGAADDDFFASVEAEARTLAGNLRAACLALPAPKLVDAFDQVYAAKTAHLSEQQAAYADYLASFSDVGSPA